MLVDVYCFQEEKLVTRHLSGSDTPYGAIHDAKEEIKGSFVGVASRVEEEGAYADGGHVVRYLYNTLLRGKSKST